MKKYLIDENLPIKLGFINNASYLHIKTFIERLTDSDIWELSLKENLTIVTQDSDFLERAKFSPHSPNLIHIKLGNMKLHDFHNFMEANWSKISQLSDENKLIIVHRDKIEFVK